MADNTPTVINDISAIAAQSSAPNTGMVQPAPAQAPQVQAPTGPTQVNDIMQYQASNTQAQATDIPIPEELKGISNLDTTRLNDPSYLLLAQRYANSSAEGKRLYEDNQALKNSSANSPEFAQQQALYEAVTSNPELSALVSSALQTGQIPQSQSTEINPQDYGLESTDDFDLTEAIADPQGKHGRFWEAQQQARISTVVKSEVSNAMKQQSATINQRDQQIEQEMIKQRYVLDPANKTSTEEYEAAMKYMSETTFSPGHALLLYRQSKQQSANPNQQFRDQMNRAAAVPNSIAALGSQGRQAPMTDAELTRSKFNSIKGQDPFAIQ